jgi:hypothetical protein
VPWIENYKAPVRELPAPTSRSARDDWRSALGPRVGIASWEQSNARWGDWKEFFTAELAENRWQEVLDMWIGRRAPGMSGATAGRL